MPGTLLIPKLIDLFRNLPNGLVQLPNCCMIWLIDIDLLWHYTKTFP